MITRPSIPIRRLPVDPHLGSTWRQASRRRIDRALAAAQSRDPGGWYVVGASTELGATSIVRSVAGREVTLWRGADGAVQAGPGACPHMGAELDGCAVRGNQLLCRWHGMALPRDAAGAWRTYPSHDDGVLLWVHVATEDRVSHIRPVLPTRPDPARSIATVVSMDVICEPSDIIANRLDPWHGAWFHPQAFSHLTVDESRSTDDALVLEVAFRLGKTWAVPVVASFTTPDARTIVMHILEGEGAGSVVETHATPTRVDAEGRQHTLMTEATIATSDRPGFQYARRLARVIRPFVRRTARQLWVDDAAYAERRYALRRAQADSAPAAGADLTSHPRERS